MDFRCDGCGTRYSTMPAVRQGLAFRYRCRVCTHMIFVRPDAAAPAANARPPADPGRDGAPRGAGLANLRLVAPPAPTPPPLAGPLFTPPVAGATVRASGQGHAQVGDDAEVGEEVELPLSHAGALATVAVPVRRPAPPPPPPRIRPSFRPADAPNRDARPEVTPTVPLPLSGRRGRLAAFLDHLDRRGAWRSLTRTHRLAAVGAVFTGITAATIVAGVALHLSEGEAPRAAAPARAPVPAFAAPGRAPAAPSLAPRPPPPVASRPAPTAPAPTPPAARAREALPEPPQRIEAPVKLPRPTRREAAPARHPPPEEPLRRASPARPPRAEREPARAHHPGAPREPQVAFASTPEPQRAVRREPLPPAPAPAAAPAAARADLRAATRPGAERDDEPVVARAGYRAPAPLTPRCVEQGIRLPAGWDDRLPGSVILRFAVNRAGTPELIQTQPGPDRLPGERVEPDIVQALAAAVRGCRFTPGADDQGRPTRMWTVMKIQFAR